MHKIRIKCPSAASKKVERVHNFPFLSGCFAFNTPGKFWGEIINFDAWDSNTPYSDSQHFITQ